MRVTHQRIPSSKSRRSSHEAPTTLIPRYFRLPKVGPPMSRAVAEINDDLETLLEFYHYPAEYWIHLLTANPIESTFATVRPRTKVTKSLGSRAAGIPMAGYERPRTCSRWSAPAPSFVKENF